jgi:glyoxylate/hydroxypyruvate reductase A
MTLLIDIRQPVWLKEVDLRDRLAPLLPGVEILCRAPDAPLAGVTMAAVSRLYPGLVPLLPDLRLVQKLGAGVDTILTDPDLPADVRVTRLAAETPAREISEYALAYVLREQRNLLRHQADAAAGLWQKVAPRLTEHTTVGILGLGFIGARTATLFAGLGFRVLGWSRSPRTLEGVECHSGMDALPALLSQCDHVVSILPSTPQTRDLFDATLLAAMKPGSMLINAGRGDLIVDADLTAALDAGRPGIAVLDVFRTEPLPEAHPFWRDPRITITPHVSGWHQGDALLDVAENYRRLTEGRPLLHEVDRAIGY